MPTGAAIELKEVLSIQTIEVIDTSVKMNISLKHQFIHKKISCGICFSSIASFYFDDHD